MISAVLKWLRQRWWAIEDKVVDVLDRQPRPTPALKPLPPAPPSDQHRYVQYSMVGVGFNRADAKSIDAEWQQRIFKQMASGRFFELRF
jgi:hypothetical protein